ncbi:hypothetical protein RhiirC2_777263 [Rhizophagus irregularis]|uniref:Uncharacterized protein n=1 Tax=Rhizophagus irregularis TaxID=588596 RepID=A0A2N1NET0_9GLOM|nr:hypothetical protein RhiirC2_777263 [Rhizophagus irregularis]
MPIYCKPLAKIKDDAHRHEQNLRQELNTSLADVLRVRRMLEDALNDESDERNARKYWHDTTQQNQYRRNNRRWTVRYNNDTERWRRMSNGCIRQAQHLKGQFRASQIQVNNLQQTLFLQNNALPNMATI